MLSNLLFEQIVSMSFRPNLDYSVMEQGVLLLANIYLNAGALKKGQELCRKYIGINYNSYPVMHIQGVMHLRQGIVA